ncbi:MAG: toxic anion resistance protein [Lachnospiraceae bacterium]|nr:toxic anion resistance protein [Lachnospiraceae bacterium]MDD7026589.1 toxic anion resistance protein [Lachnospiraceae bacterium]MDY5700869.1 toxic anion resistance protein [Lachnospiraceae bacterium]
MDKFTDAEILESAPTLTFEPFAEEKALPDPEKPEELAEIKKELEEPALTDEEKKMVQEFSEKIDLKNSNQILQYGAGAQKKIADFSQSALDNVRTRDLGEVGDLLAGVVGELKEFDVEEDKGFLGIFKKAGNRLDTLKARYSKAEANVNNMVQVLEGHQIQLMKDTAMLDKMYDINKNYFKELNMYILAGKKKIEQTKNVDLPALMEKAKASGQAEDAQEVNDMKAMVDRFEKKIHDLELTKTISLQMAPQIRMIQHNDVVMAEKIQSTLVNTIPLWKSQMVLALGMNRSVEAAKAQQAVTDVTNELLRKNAAILHQSSVETARAAEQSIVDINTLTETNQLLIQTLDEVMQIQTEGRQKRQQAEVELNRIESTLKERLLQMRG